MVRNSGGRGGFSLVELIVAVAVFTIALLGLMSALVGAQHVDSLTRERTNVVLQAQTVMDDVLAETWGANLDARHNEAFDATFEIPTGTGTVTLKPADDNWADGRLKAGLILVTTPVADARLIHVSVRWKSGANIDARVDLYSLVAKH